jgi:hypothetical protein
MFWVEFHRVSLSLSLGWSNWIRERERMTETSNYNISSRHNSGYNTAAIVRDEKKSTHNNSIEREGNRFIIIHLALPVYK